MNLLRCSDQDHSGDSPEMDFRSNFHPGQIIRSGKRLLPDGLAGYRPISGIDIFRREEFAAEENLQVIWAPHFFCSNAPIVKWI